jgi:hypothetical protein
MIDLRVVVELSLAKDGALVMLSSTVFGDIKFMTDRQQAFIENREAESGRAGRLA